MSRVPAPGGVNHFFSVAVVSKDYMEIRKLKLGNWDYLTRLGRILWIVSVIPRSVKGEKGGDKRSLIRLCLHDQLPAQQNRPLLQTVQVANIIIAQSLGQS